MIKPIERDKCIDEREFKDLLDLRNRAVNDPEARLTGPIVNVYADKVVLKYKLSHGFGMFFEQTEVDSKAQAQIACTLEGWTLVDQTKPLMYANGEVIDLKY